MIIKVTEEDIRIGQRGNGFECPIALAVRRQSGIHDVYVGVKHVDIGFRVVLPLGQLVGSDVLLWYCPMQLYLLPKTLIS